MQISLLLALQILKLFAIMLMGYAIVKLGLLKASDSKALSVVLVYLIMPCVIINAFQVEATPEVQKGLALACVAGLAVLYAIGVPYMALILNGYMGKGMSVSGLLWAGMLPFLPGDAIKIVITAVLCPLLRRRISMK